MRFLLVIVLVSFISSCEKSRVGTPPERLATVPENANWAGGTDGGNWFQLVRSDGDSVFYIKIYDDQTGEIEADEAFVLNQDCNVNRLDKSGIFQNIDGYDGNVIILNMIVNGKNCYLSPRK